MSFDINPMQGLSARMAPVQATGRASGTQAPSSAAPTDAVRVELGGGIPSSPPAEVLDAMGTAAQAHARLAVQDRGLGFAIDDHTGKVVVSVYNNAGQVLFTVPNVKALDIASGGSLDQ